MIISFSKLGGGGGYVLPAATQSTLGGVKVGSGLTIDSGGTLSADGGGAGLPAKIYDFAKSTTTAERIAIYNEFASNPSGYTYYFVRTNNDEVGSRSIASTYFWDGEYIWMNFYGGDNVASGTPKYFVNKLDSAGTITVTETKELGGGGGVQVVTDLSEITNPTSGMTALIPQGTPYHGKGWRFVPSGSNFQFTFVDNEQHVRISVNFSSQDEMVFYVNNGHYQISERVLRDGNMFEGFSYAANAAVKVGYSGTSVAYVDVLFVEGVDKWMELTDSGSTTVTPIEYDVLVPNIDYDREYVYRGATLFDKQLSGYTIDLSQFSAQEDVSTIVQIDAAFANRWDSEQRDTRNIQIGFQYGPDNNGQEFFYIKADEFNTNIAFTDDNNWRCIKLGNSQKMVWFKQSGTTITIKPWPTNESDIMTGVTVSYQRGDVSTAADNSNVKIIEEWVPKHTKPFALVDGKVLFRHGYDITLLIYKTLGAFSYVYFKNYPEEAEGIDTFLFNNGYWIAAGENFRSENADGGEFRVMLGENTQAKISFAIPYTESGVWYGDGYDWSYSNTSYPGSNHTFFKYEPWVDEDGHLRFGDLEYNSGGNYGDDVINYKNYNYIMGSVSAGGYNELEPCFPIIPLKPIANDGGTTVTCPRIKRTWVHNDGSNEVELCYEGYKLSFTYVTEWNGSYRETYIRNATLTTLS